MDPRLLLRLSRAARRGHSMRKVWFLLGIAAACLAIWAIERHVGWPAAFSGEWTRPPARVE